MAERLKDISRPIANFPFRKKLADYCDAVDLYLLRHRACGKEPLPPSRHEFQGWWEHLGARHPKWFMMREDGCRGPAPGQSKYKVSPCLSNPDFQDYIVNEAWPEMKKKYGDDVLCLGDVDKFVFCHCPRCEAWYGPQPQPPLPKLGRAYKPRCTSARYAKFWKIIYERTSEKDPDVVVTSFLYYNYFPAPFSNIKLNKNIWLYFVPWSMGKAVYFPMPKKYCEWLKKQWIGWRATGATLVYRPNHLHGGYVMPNICTHQYGDFFKFIYDNGMAGLSVDALFGHWAVKGPMLYLHVRLAEKPSLSVEQVLREYFSAFGPAADKIRAYFNFWEDYSLDHGHSLGNSIGADKAYPPAIFAKAQTLLDQASSTLEDKHSKYAARVRFLQEGLKHARLAARFMGTLDQGGKVPKDELRFQTSRSALIELIKFRNTHEEPFVADYVDASNREKRHVKGIARLLKTIP